MAPGMGWASCGVAQGFAWGVRARQRSDEGGGWGRTWHPSLADAAFTAATFGVGRALSFGRYGMWGGAWRSGLGGLRKDEASRMAPGWVEVGNSTNVAIQENAKPYGFRILDSQGSLLGDIRHLGAPPK
jgi:hypothetical protein